MSKKEWLPTSLILFILIYSSLIQATPSQLSITLASYSDGLSQPTITSIHQDTHGFLWIGTQSGLNRYNGSDFTFFTSNIESENWIPASYISGISETSNGELWIATYGGGLARYNEVEDTFESVEVPSHGSYRFLKSMFISENGEIWFGSRNSGIGMYDPVLHRFLPWISESIDNDEIGNSSEVFEDDQNKIWATGKNGLYLVDRDRQVLTKFPIHSLNSPVPVENITAVTRNSPREIYVGTNAGNIYKFDTKSSVYSPVSQALDLGIGWITDLVFGRGNLWVAADNGLSVLDFANKDYQTYESSNSLLTTDTIISLLRIGETMLAGTDQGLNLVSKSHFEKYPQGNSIIFDDVFSFTEDTDGNIWIGTFDGVYLKNGNDLAHRPLEDIFPRLKLADRRVTAISVRDNELWLGYFRGGVEIVNLENGVVRSPVFPTNKNLGVTSIIHDKNGVTWIGTYNDGLYRIQGEDVFSYLNSNVIGKYLPAVAVVHLLETQGGTLLIGSDASLFEVNIMTGETTALGPILGSHSPAIIATVAENGNGDIWIGVQDKGLFIWQRNDDTSMVKDHNIFIVNSSLSGSTIYAIEFDSKGNAWISTSNGISKLNTRGELIKSYTTVDGLQGNDFNISSSFKDSQGRIYFGGSNGYNRFDPNHGTTVTLPSPVVLTHLVIAGSQPQLPVAIHKLESIELSYLDYFVTFSFSVLDYIDPELSQYRYKLDNFDPQWIENGRRNSATYTNLPAGDYTFQVQGANSAGVWNREGFSIRLIVHPAPWFSWPAYILYVALFIGAVLLAKKYYDNIVLREKATQMAQEMHDAADRATDDLQEQLEFQDEFVKVVHAHGVNTLGLVSQFISQQAAYVEDDSAREAILNNSHRVAALAQLESCLFYKGDELLANLEDFTNIIISQLLKESPSMAESIVTVNEMPSQLIPAEIATPLSIVIFELLRNSFQYAFEKSSPANYIHIRLEKDEDQQSVQDNRYKLSVQDNGIGMPENLITATVETSGLAIVSSIAEEMGGSIHISTENGTSISMVFPIHPGTL